MRCSAPGFFPNCSRAEYTVPETMGIMALYMVCITAAAVLFEVPVSPGRAEEAPHEEKVLWLVFIVALVCLSAPKNRGPLGGRIWGFI